MAGERGDEVGHLAVTSEAAELGLGFKQARRAPAAAHVALVPPAFHVAGRGTGDGNHRLHHVRANQRLGIDGTLARTLVCTNMVESMISIARTTTRNVKRWRDEGDMRRRWCAAGLLEAERKFRRLRGHRQMPDLVEALARHARTLTPTRDTDTTSAA